MLLWPPICRTGWECTTATKPTCKESAAHENTSLRVFDVYAYSSNYLVGGCRTDQPARVDPFDQHAASSPSRVGGNGVSADQPKEEQHLDPAEGVVAAAVAN